MHPDRKGKRQNRKDKDNEVQSRCDRQEPQACLEEPHHYKEGLGSCLVDKGEYVDAEKWFCDCGYDDWIENTTEHQQLHEGLFDNHIEVRRRCVVVGKVDMGDWWDKKVVDYQYCDCGARR